METQALLLCIRQKLAEGQLPHDGVSRLWGGPGNSEICHACDEVIAKPGLIMTGLAGAELLPLNLHLQCFYIWESERRHAGDTVARPATPELPLFSPSLAGVGVLLVDDDEVALYAWRRYLVRAGAHVTSATDGHSALAELRRGTVDVLVSDLALPGIDGLELAKAAGTLGRAVIAIAVTGFPERRAQALAAGFAACLEKPLDPPNLVQEIARRTTRG